jgi:hypothetical protein
MTPEEYKQRVSANAHKARDLLDTFFSATLAPLAGQEGTMEIWNAWDTISFAIAYAYPKDK